MWFTPFPTFMTQDFWLFLAETEGIDQASQLDAVAHSYFLETGNR